VRLCVSDFHILQLFDGKDKAAMHQAYAWELAIIFGKNYAQGSST
jgi:hypothetical protein